MTIMVERPRPPSWMTLAACDGMDTEKFFPEFDFMLEPAIVAACLRCKVRDDCLAWALETDQEYGYWGGMTEEQRRKLTTTRSRVRCPDCRSDAVAEVGRFEVCRACGLSWPV